MLAKPRPRLRGRPGGGALSFRRMSPQLFRLRFQGSCVAAPLDLQLEGTMEAELELMMVEAWIQGDRTKLLMRVSMTT